MADGLFGGAARPEDGRDDPTQEIPPVPEIGEGGAAEGADGSDACKEPRKRRRAAAAALACGAVAAAVIAGAGVASLASRSAIDSGRTDTYEQAADGQGSGEGQAQPGAGSATEAAGSGDAAQAVQPGHVHAWEPAYGISHVERKSHTEHRDAVREVQTVRETVCNRCQAVITGKTAEHKAQTGHSEWTTGVPVQEEVETEPAQDVEVVDEEAHDEYALQGYTCTCGATLTVDEAKESGVWRETDEQRAEAE